MFQFLSILVVVVVTVAAVTVLVIDTEGFDVAKRRNIFHLGDVIEFKPFDIDFLNCSQNLLTMCAFIY